MRLDRAGSFAIMLILLGIVLCRGSVTGFAPAGQGGENGCKDGDGGVFPIVASSAHSARGVLYDSCSEDGAGLFEAVCSGDRAEYRYINCAYEAGEGSYCAREGPGARCT